jgi:arabinofuranan 3-O-arabinosyltransferase
VLPNFIVGQNGFLTASLIGGALVLLEGNPIAAGILLGLLTYKPHLGLLFPIALAAGGYWRAFFTAALVAMLMAAASWLAFGSEAWLAFLGNIGHTSQAFLSEGWADWSKLQTAFGLTRTLGGSETLAWIVQAAVSLLAAVSVAIVWRSKAAYDLKAAVIGVGALLATPYLYTYDLVVLAVPIAFLLRLGDARGYLPKDSPKNLPKELPRELIGIGVACGLILIFPFVKFPVGLAALLLIAGLVARRVVLPASVAA